ncbi:MAG: polysaccharide deacetylase family protein [Deltaproteobacteria bacterium]|nr:polysaccharide deacetylase family protein [Deltaproteobacteria bacterium]
MTILRLATSHTVLSIVGSIFRKDIIVQGSKQSSNIALTFDDGPDPLYTPGILKALEDANVKATFFVVGKQALKSPDLVREIISRGHEVGTHLFTHRRGIVNRDDIFLDELERSVQLLSNLTERPVNLLRFPYGQCRRRQVKYVRDRGLFVVYWTFSSLDSRLAEPADIVHRVSEALRPGAIILLHDGVADAETIAPPYLSTRKATVSAMPDILELLAKRNLKAVTLSQLMGNMNETI